MISIDYQLVVLCIIAAMALVTVVNMVTVRSLRGGQKPPETPMVSVLLPARNEALNIRDCLSRLAEQDYPDYEVLVLDDNSDDGTATMAEEMSRGNARVRVLRGKHLPPGWTGKAFACHQLAECANGQILLFTDADTIHSSQSISAAVSALFRHEAGLLTVIPHQVMKSFWEKVFLPILHFVTWCYLPYPLVRYTKNPRFAMANGQFMMFRRAVYDAIGGHASVRTALVEDVWLSRSVKANGDTLAIMDGGDAVSCRMYTDFRGIWEGFSKNLFPGFRYSITAISAVIVFNALTSILPFVLLFLGIVTNAAREPWFLAVAAQVVLLCAIRLLIAYRFRIDIWTIFLHPLAMLLLIAIAINSCRWVLVGGGARWKGRAYDFRKQMIKHIIKEGN